MNTEISFAPGAQSRHGPGRGLHRLANGMEIAYQNRSELQHFFEDIFEKEIYVSHGIVLDDEACVLDIGANIGLFTLFVQHKWPRSRVWAFEPAPPLFEILRFNAARYAPNARIFNCGVARESGEAEFTFYPQSSGMSSFHARQDEERDILKTLLENEARAGVYGAKDLLAHFDDYAEDRLESTACTCRLITLREVIREHGIQRVDLMKIDVQKSELNVLLGLAEEDWPRVRQIVIEVHDIDGRVARVSELLAGRGYDVHHEQDEMYVGSNIYNLYAIRREAPPSVRGDGRFDGARLRKIKDRGARQRMLLRRPKHS